MTQKYITDLHAEFTNWKKDLDFYRDEIKTFNNRLGELVSMNSKVEITSQIERFQNQFIRQNEVMDELMHDINAAQHELVENAKSNNIATDHRKVESDDSLADRMETFVKLYDEMKSEFSRFAAEAY
ncbi:MAG: hypothetical protein H6607_01510 [Flavobacteriales bacterium]|nr:hypothetical protein [Flavobacteriales bacterium]